MDEEINSADLLIFKAGELLDKDDVEGALNALEEAIEVAHTANHPLQLIRAKTVLGELVAELGQEADAIRQFDDVISIGETWQGDPEEIEDEIGAAREALARLKKSDA